MLNPAGGNPAAITSLPGLGGALGSVGGRLTAFTAELPGQSAQFRTAPLPAPLLVAGAPRVAVTVARLPGQPAPAEAVLFAKTYEVTPDGLRTLLGSAVAPIRIAVPADGAPARVTVTLPGVVAPIEAGNRLLVSVSTTDQGYASDPRARGLADRAGRRGDRPCRWCPASRSPPTRCRSAPAIGIGVVLGRRAARLARGPDDRPPPDRAAAAAGRAAGRRCRSATWPRRTGAGSARCRASPSASSRAWCSACSARTAPARPPCCGC